MRRETIRAKIDEIEAKMVGMGVCRLRSHNCYDLVYADKEQERAYWALSFEKSVLYGKMSRLMVRAAARERAAMVAALEARGEEVGREVRNETNDCGVVAVQHCFGVSYDEAYKRLKALGRKDRRGTKLEMLEKLGLVEVPLARCLS